VVNDYWQEGGLRLLGTLSKYSDFLPAGFITHLLEVRLTMLPAVAGRAVRYQPQIILDYLSEARNLAEDAGAFADYDWQLQMLMARNSQNPVFSLILNDFSQIFANMALRYFTRGRARRASGQYYRELTHAIENRAGIVEDIVKKAMAQSIEIWQELKKDEVNPCDAGTAGVI
jgi:GntR family negative regulator for fad regulon and positive regulator of fabA